MQVTRRLFRALSIIRPRPMLESATIFIGPSSAPEVEEIFKRHTKTYSTGLLLLPEGESDPVKYCNQMQNVGFVKWNTSVDLEQKLQRIHLTDRSIVIVAMELEMYSGLSLFINSLLDDTLVSPSARYLNGSRVPFNG